MKANVDDISSLLALKRHERPPEGYLEDFLHEFHARRRDEALASGSAGDLWERLRQWFAPSSTSKWVYGGGLAYAAAVVLFVSIERDPEIVAPPLEGASYQIEVAEPPAAAEESAADPVDDLDETPAEGQF